MAANLTFIVLTFNEEENLPATLSSMQSVGCEIFVVDSGSTDRTKDIACQYGAIVFDHPFHSHAQQWAWALEHLPIRTEWVAALDADQRLTPELATELRAMMTDGSGLLQGTNGLYINRRQIFRGRWIKHGTYYPKYLLKVFRKDHARFDPHDLLDHHFYVDGNTANLRHDLIEENRKENDIGFWISKHVKYAGLVAQEEFQRNSSLTSTTPIEASLTGNPDQRTLRLKHWWRRMPLFVRPPLYFLYRYVLRLGWLDGKEGFLFHFLHAWWFRLLVDVKLEELKKSHNT